MRIKITQLNSKFGCVFCLKNLQMEERNAPWNL